MQKQSSQRKSSLGMKAAVCTAYGSSEVFHYTTVPIPEVSSNEILIQNYSSVVTFTEVIGRKGTPFIIRLFGGLFKPNKPIFGGYWAGVVCKIGDKVKNITIGDSLYGTTMAKGGTFAEYVKVAHDSILDQIPSNLSYAQAAALPYGALTSLIFLRDSIQIEKGQSILINGAAGGVGIYAVQLATHFGAEVTAVCKTNQFTLMHALGAKHCIDYSEEDFATMPFSYDYILDVVGNRNFFRCKKALKPRGIFLSTVPSMSIVWSVMVSKLLSQKKAKFVASSFSWTKEDLQFISACIKEGILLPVIDKSYPLHEIHLAHDHLEKGGVTGHIPLKIKADKVDEI